MAGFGLMCKRMGMTLELGDVLLTGTPSGIGNAHTPSAFLKDENHIIVCATGLSELSNGNPPFLAFSRSRKAMRPWPAAVLG